MIQTACYTDIGGRPQNEDSTREVWKNGNLCLVVADGLGGHGGGAQASSITVDQICRFWDGRVDTKQLSDLLQLAHISVQEIQTDACAMKSTAVVLLLDAHHAAWAHVGDSRLYHFYNGRLVFQTKDHSASQLAVTLGEITSDQIRFHPDRARILRALGQDNELKVETGEEQLLPGFHAFLLCSDGFWEYVLEEDMLRDLECSATPEQWLSAMLERLLHRVPKDNDNNTAAAAWIAVE